MLAGLYEANIESTFIANSGLRVINEQQNQVYHARRQAESMIQVTESDNGQQINLRRNEIVEVDLDENPTTGYRWHIVSDGAPVCALTVNSFQAGQNTGQGGKHSWQFQAAKTGTGKISLAYRRDDSPV